jgi:hypothetical protein
MGQNCRTYHKNIEKEHRRQKGQRELMEQYFKWHPPEKVRNKTRSKQRHKQDLRPD